LWLLYIYVGNQSITWIHRVHNAVFGLENRRNLCTFEHLSKKN
jgi:hypothetical protein